MPRIIPTLNWTNENPLLHYASVGWRKGYNPSGAFDTVRYLLTHYDVLATGQDPLLHYLTYGRAEHREIFAVPAAPIVGIRAAEPNVLRRNGTARPPAQAQSFALSPSPLVSIIIPNFNGAAHLRDLFESLKAQTYENFEVVFVDDDLTDELDRDRGTLQCRSCRQNEKKRRLRRGEQPRAV